MHRSRLLVHRQLSLPAYTRVVNFCHIFGRGNGSAYTRDGLYASIYSTLNDQYVLTILTTETGVPIHESVTKKENFISYQAVDPSSTGWHAVMASGVLANLELYERSEVLFPYFHTSSKDILLLVSLPHFSCPSCLEYLCPRALILLRLWRYINQVLTYLLTYLLTFPLHSFPLPSPSLPSYSPLPSLIWWQ